MSFTISVVIPTYNRQECLIRAVKSVLNQTYPISEIIVCDDGSTDNSFNLIRQLNESKIIWLNCGRNGMPSIPRNMGIKKAKSDWIAFLDSDDEWSPEKIKMQVEILQKKKHLAVCTNANTIINEKNVGTYIDFINNRIGLNTLLLDNLIICSSVIINKGLLNKISYFPENEDFKAIEDYDLWLKVSCVTEFYFLNKPVVNYYDNPKFSLRNEIKKDLSIMDIIPNSLLEWKSNYKYDTPHFSLNKILQKKNNSYKYKFDRFVYFSVKKIMKILLKKLFY